MKKNYVLWFALWAFFLIGCRNDNFSSSEAANNQQALKFRVVRKSEIPQVMSTLQSETDNFKIRLKTGSSVNGRTETIFGEINTDFITAVNDGDDTYYTFSIKNNEQANEGSIYNLEVKTSKDTNAESINVYERIPTAEWLTNGNNDFSKFSGTVNVYTVEGDLENTISYVAGTANCPPPPPPPPPCPDCPVDPQGPGGGTGGGGGGPGGGTVPPGTGGPISYPGGGSGGGGGGGCGGFTFSEHIGYQNPVTGAWTYTGEVWINGCGETITIMYRPANKTGCSGGAGGGDGVVIYDQTKTPCGKTKALMEKSDVKSVVQDLKSHITNGTGEKGWKFNKTGSPTQTTENSDHSVNFGNPSLLNGGYHNHTGTKVDIFSSTDIATLIEIARYNGSSNPTNAFMGLIAPNGIHYIIRFKGLQTDLPAFGSFSETQIEIWKIDQITLWQQLLKKNSYYSIVNGKKILNSKGLEKILFDTLEKMGLKDKVIVQKMDDNNNVSTVIQNPDKTTTSLPCP